jgi:hypothetical protein
MSIGLERPLSSHRLGRGRTAQPTIREVCLLGRRSHRAEDGRAWATGQRVTWLGRGYQVVATSEIPAGLTPGRSAATATDHYVHLAPSLDIPEPAR